MKNKIITLFILGLSTSVSAAIINIPADWPTIQQGIDASSDGDTVLVQPGTYVENINFNGHNIVLGSLFLTTGDTSYISQTIIDGNSSGTVVTFESGEDSTTFICGFTIQNGHAYYWGAGIESVESSPNVINNIIKQNRSSSADISHGGGLSFVGGNPVIIDNVIKNNIVYGLNSYGGGIYFGGDITNYIFSGNTVDSNLADFPIQVPGFSFGGGIFGGPGDAEIRNNLITNNSAAAGGGICVYGDGNTLIENNNIVGNGSYDGGGIFAVDALINGNLISENGCGRKGGGICFGGSNSVASNNIIINNEGYEGGGGIDTWGESAVISCNIIMSNISAWFGTGAGISSSGDIVIYNNLISENISIGNAGKGGGIYLEGEYLFTIINNIIYANFADEGGALFCENANSLNIINTIMRSDSANGSMEIFIESGTSHLEYCNIQGGWPGVGNIDLDPLFRDPDNGDFHLMSVACGDSADSPCIDAGDPNILDSLLDCSWGLGGPRSDMGAYGGGDSLITSIFDNLPPLPDKAVLLQNYPNPFNAQTTIRFILAESGDTQLTIYDLLGRQVKVLVDDYMQSGAQAVTFDASGISSGVYFYRLQAGDKVETKRMLLLK